MIGIIGICHKSAPVEIREKYSLGKKEIEGLSKLDLVKNNKIHFVVLSTCNRTEIYFECSEDCVFQPSVKSISGIFHPVFQISDSDEKHFYLHTNTKAIRHLFRVISGMESLAFGEDQIIKQVKDALLVAENQQKLGTILRRLFQKAFETSKKIRTETGISQGGYSISSVAVNLASRSFSNLSNCCVMLLGAGETSELVLKNFRKRGVNNIFIANRTLSNSQKLAEKYQGIVVAMKDFKEHLVKADILITSTSAGKQLITRSMMQEIMHNRKPISIIDISVPRNVENSVGLLKNVELQNIDKLEEIVECSKAKRKDQELEATAIVDCMALEFEHWLNSMAVAPLIEDLKSKINETNTSELKKLRNKLSEEEFEKVANYGNYITKKLTNQIITRLREDYSNGSKNNCLEAVKTIFDLG